MSGKPLNELVALVGDIYQEAMGTENVKTATTLANKLSREAHAATRKALKPAEDMWQSAELHGAAIEAHKEAKRAHDLLVRHHWDKDNTRKTVLHDRHAEIHDRAQAKHYRALDVLQKHPDFEKGFSDFQHDKGFQGAVKIRKPKPAKE